MYHIRQVSPFAHLSHYDSTVYHNEIRSISELIFVKNKAYDFNVNVNVTAEKLRLAFMMDYNVNKIFI